MIIIFIIFPLFYQIFLAWQVGISALYLSVFVMIQLCIRYWWFSSFVILVFPGGSATYLFRAVFVCLHRCQALTTISMRLVQILGVMEGWEWMISVDTSCVTGKGGEKENRKTTGTGPFLSPKMMGFSKFGLFSGAKMWLFGAMVISHSLVLWNGICAKGGMYPRESHMNFRLSSLF